MSKITMYEYLVIDCEIRNEKNSKKQPATLEKRKYWREAKRKSRERIRELKDK